MISQRPYLIRAIYQWILDNQFTPHLLVNATAENVEVPQEFVIDGTIVLNITPESIVDLDMANDFIQFKAMFSGISQQIFIPPSAVLGIFAKENHQGMLFSADDPTDNDNNKPPTTKKAKAPKKAKPTLKIVK